MSRAAGSDLGIAGARAGAGLGLNPPEPENPEAEEFEPGNWRRLSPSRLNPRASWPSLTSGLLNPRAARCRTGVRVACVAPGRTTATAQVTTLARAAAVVTETTLACPSSRAAAPPPDVGANHEGNVTAGRLRGPRRLTSGHAQAGRLNRPARLPPAASRPDLDYRVLCSAPAYFSLLCLLRHRGATTGRWAGDVGIKARIVRSRLGRG
jgi:hypothetical protein